MRKRQLYHKLMSEYDVIINDNILEKIKEKSEFTAISQQQNCKYRTLWKVSIATVTCITISITALILLPKFKDSANLHSSSVKSESFNNYLDAEIPKWENRSIDSKFDRLYIDDELFSSTKETVINSNISKFLYKTTLIGYDYTDPNYYLDVTKAKQYKIEAEVYSVKSIESKFLVAVKYDGQDNFYSFIPNDYKPNTLGNLLKDLNLKNNLTIGKVYFDENKDNQNSDIEYDIPDINVFWGILNSSQNAEFISADEKNDFSWDMTINVSIDIAGQKNKSFVVSKDGYLFTNIYDEGKVFFIGKEKTTNFINYILSNN